MDRAERDIVGNPGFPERGLQRTAHPHTLACNSVTALKTGAAVMIHDEPEAMYEDRPEGLGGGARAQHKSFFVTAFV